MKRSIRLGTTMSVSLSLLLVAAACSAGGAQEDKPGTNPSQSPAPGTADSSKKITMTMVTSQQAPIRKDAEMVAYYNEKLNMNIQVWDIDSTKWNELLNLKFASGEIPDNIFVQGFPNLQKYVSNDLLAEIPLELIREYAPTLHKLLEADVPGIFNYGKVDGKIYGIPQLRPDNRYRNAIAYRGDWMKAVGIEKAPETLDEFEKLMTAFATGDPEKNGKKTYGLSKSGMDVVYGSFGYIPGLWQEKDGKLVYASVQPEMKQALGYLNKWYKSGLLEPEFLTGESKGGNSALSNAFVQGRIGMSSIGQYYDWKPLLFDGDCCSINYIELGKLNQKAADSLVFGMPPKGPNGKSGVLQRSMVSGNFVGFGKQVTKEPGKMERMLKFYEYMFSSLDNYMVSKFGIKGKHWDYNGNKVATMMGDMKTTSDQAAIGAHTVLNNLDTIPYVEHRLNARYMWANQLKFQEGGITSKLLAPLPSSTKYNEELNKIEQETYISIITGDQPLDAFDRFVDRWNKGGGEQLTKEANEWYAGLKK